MKVKIAFLQSGESPEFGVFKEGDGMDGGRDMDKDTAELLEKRKVLRILSEKEAAELAAKAAQATAAAPASVEKAASASDVAVKSALRTSHSALKKEGD